MQQRCFEVMEVVLFMLDYRGPNFVLYVFKGLQLQRFLRAT